MNVGHPPFASTPPSMRFGPRNGSRKPLRVRHQSDRPRASQNKRSNYFLTVTKRGAFEHQQQTIKLSDKFFFSSLFFSNPLPHNHLRLAHSSESRVKRSEKDTISLQSILPQKRTFPSFHSFLSHIPLFSQGSSSYYLFTHVYSKRKKDFCREGGMEGRRRIVGTCYYCGLERIQVCHRCRSPWNPLLGRDSGDF